MVNELSVISSTLSKRRSKSGKRQEDGQLHPRMGSMDRCASRLVHVDGDQDVNGVISNKVVVGDMEALENARRVAMIPVTFDRCMLL